MGSFFGAGMDMGTTVPPWLEYILACSNGYCNPLEEQGEAQGNTSLYGLTVILLKTPAST